MPNVYVIGGPNGAGKTTVSMRLLPDFLSCLEYVNADAIAKGLSPFQPDNLAFQAGRLMLKRLDDIVNAGEAFAFETTLASRTFVPFLQSCREKGYSVTLLYIWLQNADKAVDRVTKRVARGGHSIPEHTIRRRYESSRKNFNSLYMPLADFWMAYDNSTSSPRLVADGGRGDEIVVYDPSIWQEITR